LDAISIEPGSWDKDDDERYHALQACIEMLEDADRSLVVLYLEELPYREIGEVLGLSENHVAVKLKRIRKKLFNCITKTIQ
ncbi:MAG: sigma-70 family RNA polymerase sigma factor, partial [Bacteroidota bacterium]